MMDIQQYLTQISSPHVLSIISLFNLKINAYKVADDVGSTEKTIDQGMSQIW